MSDEITTPDPAAPPAPVATPEPPKVYSEEYVKSLRDEAASHRIAKNEAVAAAKAAAQQEWEGRVTAASGKVTTLETDLGDAWVYAAKLHAGINAGVPTDKLIGFAEVLKGVDEESIKASAEQAKALFGIPASVSATDPTQGSGGGAPLGLAGDPILGVIQKMIGA